jgi:glycine cleavage system H protein
MAFFRYGAGLLNFPDGAVAVMSYEERHMSTIPADLRYAASHEWARLEADGSVTVGISDHAQEALGDVVFIELPEIGTSLSAGQEAGVVESVKAASDIYAPVGGEVIAINQALADSPESVNSDPYGSWFFRLKPSDASELDGLLDAAAYKAAADA